MQTVLQREDARQTRGNVLSNAVSDHGGWRDAVCHPPLRERVFDAEQCGLGEARARQSLVRRGCFLRGWVEQGSQIEAEVGC